MSEQLPEFTNQVDVRTWLAAQEHTIAVAFASRAALRSLPVVMKVVSPPADDVKLLLSCFRMALSTAVTAARPSAGMRNTTRKSVSKTIASRYTDTANSLTNAYSAVVDAASFAGGKPGTKTITISTSATFNSFTTDAATLAPFTAAAADAFELTQSSHPETVFSRPLWWNMHTPRDWSTAIMAFEISKDPAWRWWSKWYRQMFDGVFEDWALAEEIALLPEKDWERGPAHIARKIEIIEARRALERQIAELKAQLHVATVTQAPAPQRNHNNPPELIGDMARSYRRDINLIQSELDAAEEELAQPDPSPSRLKAIAEKLQEISVRLVAYCGAVADIAIKKAAEELGSTGVKWGLRLGAGSVAAQNDQVQIVTKSLWEFAKLLGG
jgi:hypothetical protein